MAHLGIFGGTFNPPHIGHLILAEEAVAQLQLDQVILVPTRQSPHKQIEGDPGAEERFELCQLATEGDERIVVSRIELDREGRSYTVETLRLLHKQRPKDELTFLVGADMACSLPSWREPKEVLSLCWLGVVEREGCSREEILEAVSSIPNARSRLKFLTAPRIDLSSTLVRKYVAAGRSVRYLVGECVARRIERAGYYRNMQRKPT